MAERLNVVDNLVLEFQGLFDFNEMYRVMDKWYREQGYDKYELQNFEQQTSEGKQVEVRLIPWKKLNDYVEMQHVIDILGTNLKETTIMRRGYPVKLMQGQVHINFRGLLRVDYYHRWKAQQFMFFIRTLFDFFVLKMHTDGWKMRVIEDIEDLFNTVKNYLNMHKYE